MRKPRRGTRILLLVTFVSIQLIGVIWASTGLAQDGSNTGYEPPMWAWFLISIGFLSAVLWGISRYLSGLQTRFFKACQDAGMIQLAADKPAGLPAGSIRAAIALLIVIFALFFVALGMTTKGSVPEVLTGILGTVIGFYFGNRAASQKLDTAGGDSTLEMAQKQRHNEQAGGLLNDLQKGLALTESAAAFLPKDKREGVDGLVGKLRGGIDTVGGLLHAGNAGEALKTASGLFDEFKTKNPVIEIVKNATGSFGKILGGSVPALGLITTITTVGSRIAGAAQTMWRDRILHAEFSPATFEFEPIDAQTGQVFCRTNSVFRTAFAQQLENEDGPFFHQLVRDFLQNDDTVQLWEAYKDHGQFESEDQFTNGLAEFRRSAVAGELRDHIKREWIEGDASPNDVIASIDRIREDERASADLDRLVELTDGLRQDGKDVEGVIRKVRKEIEP